MIKKKLILPIVCALGIGSVTYAGIAYANHRDALQYETVHVPEVKQEEKKVLTKAPIIQKINKLGELKVYEVETKQETKFEDDQWYGKKEMKADLYYVSQFFIPFDVIKEENIVQDTEDESKYFLLVKLPRCVTNFDESKTVEHRTKNTGVNWGRYETNLREFDATKASLKKTINNSILINKMEEAKANTVQILAPIMELVAKEGFKLEIKFVTE